MANYEAIKKHAANLGEEYLQVIDQLGEEGVERMTRQVRALFTLDEPDDREWAKAICQYMLATTGKSLSRIEEDKYMTLFFDRHVRRDRLDRQRAMLLSGKTMSAQVSEKRETIESMVEQLTEARAKLQRDEGRMRGALAGLPEDKRKTLINMLARQSDQVEKLLGESQDLLDEAGALLENSAPTTEETSKRVRAIKDALGDLGKDIDSLENELGLRFQPDIETDRERLQKIFEKVDRYMEANKGLYTWHCSECGWSGELCKRVPAEGSLADSMAHRWLWVCPECRTVMCSGDKHPFFHKDLVFSMEAWAAMCEGGLSLLNMARILNTRPQAIMWAATKILELEVPEHVKEEFEQYEREHTGDAVTEDDSVEVDDDQE